MCNKSFTILTIIIKEGEHNIHHMIRELHMGNGFGHMLQGNYNTKRDYLHEQQVTCHYYVM